MVPFEDEQYTEFMHTEMPAWLQEHVEGAQFPGYDGNPLQYYHTRDVNGAPKGTIVMLHGFCGYFRKYHEVLYDFWEKGYDVYFLEQRGHGLSYRSVPEKDRVDVGDFDEYVEDLWSLMQQIVVRGHEALRRSADGASARLPLILYGHSMGGCVATMFLEKYPDFFDAGILSSPMLKINYGFPDWQVDLLGKGSKVLKWDDRFMPGQGDFDGMPDFENSGATSRARYDYTFQGRIDPASDGAYTMNGGTYRWGRAAMKATSGIAQKEDRIQIPILILQAGKDNFVDNSAENRLRRNAQNAKIARFPEAKHEIYNADPKSLERYYRVIFRFLDEL